MAENSRSGAATWLTLLVGCVIIAVAVVSYFVYAGRNVVERDLPASINVDIDLPKVPPIPDVPSIPAPPIPTPKYPVNDQDQRPRKPIPLLLWALIGFALVFGFMVLMRTLNPPSAGMGPASPIIAVPTHPKSAPLPDVKPGP